MKLIKRLLPRRDKHGVFQYFSLFECPVCKKQVVRPHWQAIKRKSCICNKTPYGIHNPKYRHGMSYSKLYGVWASMIGRCKYKHIKSAKAYADRGISVCKEWKTAANFLTWAKSSGYKHGLFLDREDNDLGYFPGNCRWITKAESFRHKRREDAIRAMAQSIKDAVNKGMTKIEAAKVFNVGYSTVKRLCDPTRRSRAKKLL